MTQRFTHLVFRSIKFKRLHLYIMITFAVDVLVNFMELSEMIERRLLLLSYLRGLLLLLIINPIKLGKYEAVENGGPDVQIP